VKRLLIGLGCTLVAGCASPGHVGAQESVLIEYLCADWGPAMRLPTKPGDAAQFDDKEEEVYFLKQVSGRGVSIFLCKMKPDGTGKTEIKELWRNPNYPIDTQGQSTWMDVNEKTHKIGLSITYAGNDITGLWTMNSDGSDLKRIIKPDQNEKYLQAINHPSWSPNGKWVVFQEELRGMNPNRFNISRCDAAGGNFKRLLEGAKAQYMQPSFSPDGKEIVFAKYPEGYPGQRWIWLMDDDGMNVRPLIIPKSERFEEKTKGWGDWPAWSPDGTRIFYIGVAEIIADASSGKTEWAGSFQPHSPGWCHWGKHGLIGQVIGGIVSGDIETKHTKALGPSHPAKSHNSSQGDW
jgi:hypothetical protein